MSYSDDVNNEWEWIEKELEEMYDRFKKRFNLNKNNFSYYIFNSIKWN